MNALQEIGQRLKAQTAVDTNDIRKMQAVLNDTIKAVNSTNEKTRKQATLELRNMHQMVKDYGKGLGEFQQSISEHLVKTIQQAEARRTSSDTSSLATIAENVSKQAGTLTRTIINEYSKRNPLVYTGLKLFDSLKTTMVKNDKKGKTLQEKQIDLIDLQLEVAEKQKEVVEDKPATIKKRSAPVVERLEKLKESADEQVKVLTDIHQTVTGKKPEISKDTKNPTRKELAAANKELKKINKAQKMQTKHLEKEARASEAIVKIEKERLVDESKAALLEKNKVQDTSNDFVGPMPRGKDAERDGLGTIGQVFMGTFFGELLEHMMVGGGIRALVMGLVKTVGAGLFKTLGSTASLGKLAGKFLLPLSIGLASWDGIKAYNDDKKISRILDKEAKDIQMSDRIMAAISGFTSELIGGTIDSIASIFGFDTDVEGKMFSTILKTSTGILDAIEDNMDTSGLSEKLGRELSFGEKLLSYMVNSGTSIVAMVLGAIDSVMDTSLKQAFIDIKESFLARIISWKDSIKARIFGEEKEDVKVDVRSDSKPKAVSQVDVSKNIDKSITSNSAVNQSALAVNQVKQSTNINNQVFQTKTIAPRNSEQSINVLSYR